MLPQRGCTRKSANPAQHDLAEIFRVHGAAFRSSHALTPEQGKVMRAIEACRTPALGTHLEICLDCDAELTGFNSCRNRHCPKCQAIDQYRWLEDRRQRILPVNYFHVVFTLPAELHALGLRNPRQIYTLLFRAASATLMTLGHDPQWLGAQLGITMVLHTWTRDLRYHPHVHVIVTGGGLTPDGKRWIHCGENFLFPVKVIGKLFRGKFLHGLQGLHHRLDVPADLTADHAFGNMVGDLYEKDWVVYAKRPYAGPEQVFSYLGRYTHRIAISNTRLLAVTADQITISTRNGDTATLSPQELIRRFLLHVLPSGFVKIRHYGLMASANVNGRLETARALLASSTTAPTPPGGDQPPPSTDELLECEQRPQPSFLRTCQVCGSSRLKFVYCQTPPYSPPPSGRAPP